MRRRELILGLGGTLTLPLAGRAQPSSALPVVGYLNAGSSSGQRRYAAAFRQGLAESGFVDGRNLTIEFHWANGDYARLAQMVADLVRRHVAVIAAAGLPSAVAAKKATATTPIVFVAGDPTAQGLVASLSHPGSNVTGASLFMVGPLDSKRLGMLHEIAPKAKVVGLLVNPDNENTPSQLREVTNGATSLGLRAAVLKAASAAEIDAAFADIPRRGVTALLVGADAYFISRRPQIVGLAARYKVPAIYELHEFVEDGGLISYGDDVADANRQAGIYVARILKGAKPADLPVVQPTKFQLAINLKAAKALGLAVPPLLLAQADEVIQ